MAGDAANDAHKSVAADAGIKTSHLLIWLTGRMPWLPIALVKLQRWVYDITNGRLMSTIEGRPICVVTMTGARTGRTYKWALMHVPYRDGVLLVASRGGAAENPAWFHNLRAHPEIRVHVRGRHLRLRARQANAQERAALWPVCVEAYPSYADYQGWTSRDIPVFVCLPDA